MSDLIYDKRDFFAIFTYNRPDRLNALGGTLHEELAEALEDFTADPNMRAGIVTGAGRAFSAGGDLKEMGEGTFTGSMEKEFVYSGNPKPFIAAINGLAVGGGCETALDCDIRICSTNAYFGLFEPQRGIIAGYAIHHLPRVIGMSAANYMLLSARRVSPEQALAWGIVTEVVAPDRLMPRAIEIAEEIAQNAPISVQATKAAIQMWRQAGVSESMKLGSWIGRVSSNSEDRDEGIRAFNEKRPPAWTGR